jgi:hypothetical protein
MGALLMTLLFFSSPWKISPMAVNFLDNQAHLYLTHPSNLYAKTFPGDNIRKKGLWEVENGISVFIKRHQRAALPVCQMRTPDGACHLCYREPSPDMESAVALILNFPAF